jgi:two-component sensor histidine kinase
MPFSGRYVVRSTTALLFTGLLFLAAIVAMNLWLGERAHSYFNDAIASRDTRIAAVELRNALQVAESSQRGYIITGNEIYLAPYQSAKTQAQRRFAALQRLLPSYSNSDATLERLAEIIAAKFEELDQTIRLARQQREEEARAIIRTNKGKALTDEANVFFSGIIGQADQRLTEGVAEQRTNSNWLRFVSLIGAFAIVTVVAGAGIGISRYTIRLRETRDQVNALNRELEQRVTARTADLELARDRAEVLLSEVNHRVANSLALVSGLVNFQSKAVVDQSAKTALAETQERILAISLVHKRLYLSSDVRVVALDEYLRGLLDHLETSLRHRYHGVTLSSSLEPMDLDTDATINLGVIVTELVTNAFKYAYPDGTGDVRVRLQKLPEGFAELIVQDDGIGMADGLPIRGTGVGSRIVKAMCVNLGTTVETRNLQPGTAMHVKFSTTKRSVVI